MKTYIKIWSIVLGLISYNTYSQTDTLTIRYSETTPTIDGIVSDIEWIDSDSAFIHCSDNWQITILTKYDTNNLYIAFIDLVRDTNQLISEILITPENGNDTAWSTNTLWFHASYSDCFQSGKYFDWSTCSKTKSDWNANNLPFKNGNDNMEFQISLTKLYGYNITCKEKYFRLAFNVGDKFDNTSLWPGPAIIQNPSTWGYAIFK